MTIPKWLELASRAAQSTWRLSHADGTPYLTRTVLHGVDALDTHDATVPWSAFVHEIHGADGDRHAHDHPWAWAVAVVLAGGYTERRPYRAAGVGILCIDDGRVTWEHSYGVGDANVLCPGDYHSIVAVEPGTVTLFLCGREVSDWGFLVDGAHVPHRNYFARPDAQHMTHARIA